MRITTNTYDESGRLAVADTRTDYDDDGTTDSHYSLSYTYDERGNVTSLVQMQFDTRGMVTYIYSSLKTYDAEDRLLTESFSYDGDGNGKPEWEQYQFKTYDVDGNLLSSVIEYDWDVDGLIDERFSLTNTYTSNDYPIVSRYETDVYADGKIEQWSQSDHEYTWMCP